MPTSQPLADTEFIAFDLETTGLHPISAEILELGAVRFRGDGTVLGEFTQLVNPGRPIPPDSTRIHGITDRMVRQQPILPEVLPSFLEFLGAEHTRLLAHNARFDVGFLSLAIARLGLRGPAHAVYDTCTLARRRIRLSDYKLETLGRHLRLIEAEEHRAFDDAMLLKDVFVQLVRKRPLIQHAAELDQFSPRLSLLGEQLVQQQPLPGYEVLWQAMAEQRAVTIRYSGGSQAGAARVITPLQVLETSGKVYLVAHCHRDDCEKSFRMDRIAECRLA